MAGSIHICGNQRWRGAETRALLLARDSSERSVVITAAGSDAVRRFAAAGVEAYAARLSGMFASINLSRLLRHAPEECRHIYVHSINVKDMVVKAVGMSGRKDLVVCADIPEPCYSPSSSALTGPEPGGEPILVWIGSINSECGLDRLIETLGRLTHLPWRLRIVGEGESREVMPLVRRARALQMDGRIEWIGYVHDVYSAMNGASYGIVCRDDPGSSTVYKEFAAASFPVVFASDTELLFKRLSECL